MSRYVTFPGGIIPSAPASNLQYQWDDATSTVTEWDQTGAVVSTRPYTAAEKDAAAAEATFPALVAARSTLVQMASEQSTVANQIAADLASVQSGWDNLTAAERTAIMGRVVEGFSTVTTALLNHLAVSRVIPPPN